MCPLLAMCREATSEDREQGHNTQSMVWAGTPYDEFGQPIQIDALKGFIGRRDGRHYSEVNVNARASGAAA